MPFSAVDESTTTIRCQQALDYIIDYKKRIGWPPSVREMADDLGFGVATMHVILKQLVKRGAIEVAPGIARGIRVVRTKV